MKRFLGLFFGFTVFLAAGSFGLGAGARNISASAAEKADSASVEKFFQSCKSTHYNCEFDRHQIQYKAEALCRRTSSGR